MPSLRLEPHGAVTRLRLSHWRSRLVGYEVSAYLHRGALIDTLSRALDERSART